MVGCWSCISLPASCSTWMRSMPMTLSSGIPAFSSASIMQLSLAHQRVVELADLVALRQVGVEVVLAVEPAPRIDLRLDRHAGAHRLADAFAIGHGQHPRHRRIDEADLAVGLGPESGRGAGEQLGIGGDLRVDFEADHDLPFARCALDAVVAHRQSAFPFRNRSAPRHGRRASTDTIPAPSPRSHRSPPSH